MSSDADGTNTFTPSGLIPELPNAERKLETMARLTASVRLYVVVSPDVPIEISVERAKNVLEAAGIEIVVMEESLLEDVPETLRVPRVGNCSGELTHDQQRLFGLNDRKSNRDVAVYFVRATIPFVDGCAVHPDEHPGCIIASRATEWTLAHELGHVLGVAVHTDEPGRLMVSSTRQLGPPPPLPTLSSDEVSTMRRSMHVQPAVQ